MLSRKLFASEFTGLCEICDKEQSETLNDVYYETLKNLTDEQFRKAIRRVISTTIYKKLPMPAEILEAVHGNLDDKAVLALTELQSGIAKYGFYDTVQFSDTVIHMVVDAMGGWEAVSCMTIDDWKFQGKKEFINLYKACAKNPKREYPEKLVGYHERHNAFNGIKHVCRLKVIGDAPKKQIENKETDLIGG